MKHLATIFFGLFLSSIAMAPASQVGRINVDGAIGPATASYIHRAIQISGGRNDECLVIQLDTPGGLLDSTKDIVQSFYASEVPVVVYVAPSGASAGSAGCFITLAADVAAMAPNTSIGAAHPVAIGGAGDSEKPDDVMKSKMENYAVSFIESIAQKRGRNVEWARASVKESAAITAEAALTTNAIDLIAVDLPELLQKLDGRKLGDNTLNTAEAKVVNIPMILREKVFQRLWRPEVMFVLMLIAIYGIIGELSNPGAILPGTLGAVALILALYMSAILPVNVAGLALIGLAVILFVIDIFAPTHGVLTGGGILALLLGALMLFDRDNPAFRLPLSYILPGVILTALFFVFVVGKGLRAQSLPVAAGRETMIGKAVPVENAISADGGMVFIEGELWRAVAEEPIEKGSTVEVVAVEGLTLKVKRKA
jgi:membrane-bound serine protease (ClpP class)